MNGRDLARVYQRNNLLHYWKQRIREYRPHRRWPQVREHLRYLVRMCRQSLA